MKNLKLIGQFALALTLAASACQKGINEETDSIKLETSKMLTFKSNEELRGVMNSIGSMSPEDYRKWESQKGFTSLISSLPLDSTITTIPVLLQRVLNQNSEYQVADSIHWFIGSKLYAFNINDFTRPEIEGQKLLIAKDKATSNKVSLTEIKSEEIKVTINKDPKKAQISADWDGLKYERYYKYNGTDYRIFFEAKAFDSGAHKIVELKNFCQYNKKVTFGHKWTGSNVPANKVVSNCQFYATRLSAMTYSVPYASITNSTDGIVIGWVLPAGGLSNLTVSADYMEYTAPSHGNYNFRVNNAYWHTTWVE